MVKMLKHTLLIATAWAVLATGAIADGATSAAAPAASEAKPLFTLAQMKAMVALIDAGLKVSGVQIFTDGTSGRDLQDALNEIAKMEQEQSVPAAKPEETKP